MFRDSALAIHQCIERQFLIDGAMIGPDPGVRFNYRIWRFLKSYTPWFPWNDGLYYLQGQGYWVSANWMLSEENDDRFARLALAATRQVADRQRTDGAWDYPNPEWKNRVATVEGMWASFALLESYRRTGCEEFLERALQWHRFFENNIGFQIYKGMTAVNYFAGKTENPVPNNSALALRYLANMANATGDTHFLTICSPMVDFLRQVQRPTGEFPYVVDDPRMQHFQCFQYHAFFYLDVWNYYVLSGDERVREMLQGVLRFMRGALAPSGYCYYQCDQHYRTVNYHTVAAAAALSACTNIGLSDAEVAEYQSLAERAVRYVLQLQRPDGSIPHSRGDYHFLSDQRKYPRYLAMMLFHLTSIHRPVLAQV
jgi:uncharacterized protein YyaL (SSP411 family)